MRKPRRREWRRLFTVVPREWELRLLKAERVGTYHLAHELLYRHWHNGGRPITVSGILAKALGLPARSKSRALAELEQLGLIEVERKPRKSPKATLRHVCGN